MTSAALMGRFARTVGETAIVVTALAGAVIAGGCSPSQWSRAGGQVGALDARRVAWNPTNADVGRVEAVADSGDVVVVLSDRGATILSAGTVVAVDRSATRWRSAATIPAIDGGGDWIVAVDGDGKLRRLRAGRSLELVSERYGLGSDAVRSVARFGVGGAGGDATFRVAFALDVGVAMANASRLFRFDFSPPIRQVVGGGGHAAFLADNGVRAFDALHDTTRTFALEHASGVALDAFGRLYAANDRAVYAENDAGMLTVRYDATERVRSVTGSGKRVWFADGGELGVVDGEVLDRLAKSPGTAPARGAVVQVTSGAKLAAGAKLVGSASGDVWAIADGALSRFTRDDVVDPNTEWRRAIEPVFARVCAACHAANGSAGVDLSTADAWRGERAAIRERVLEEKTMPPEGHPISDAEREAIRAWVGAGGR